MEGPPGCSQSEYMLRYWPPQEVGPDVTSPPPFPGSFDCNLMIVMPE